MTKVYTLVGISTGTEATEKFFDNNKFFFAKRLNNGHFEFVGSNREVLETSTCQHFDKETTGDVVITTRNSRIQIAPAVDDSEWFRVMPRSGYGTADVQYFNGRTAFEIAAHIAYVAIYHGYTLETFKTVINRENCNSVMVRVEKGDFFDGTYRSFIFNVHIDKYETLGAEAKVRVLPWEGKGKTISLAGSPNQINKKINALFA